MRDYSKPYYDLGELTAAFNGVCKCINKDEYCCSPSIPELGNRISAVSRSKGCMIDPTGDLATTAINLQTFISFLLNQYIVDKDQLRRYIDAELVLLPHHPLINYFD